MTIMLTDRADPDSVALRRARNTTFRVSLRGGVLVFSEGILALGADAQAAIVKAVQAFNDFDKDDPWDLHDIGDLEVVVSNESGEVRRDLVFFRIVELPGIEGEVELALTLMLAREW